MADLKAQEPMVMAGAELTDAELIEEIRKAPLVLKPNVDAAPVVHGRWVIRESGPGEIECKCSACKYRDFVLRNDVYWVNRKFCPNCGAKMDGKRRDDDAAD